MFSFSKKAAPVARKRLLEQAVVRNTECWYSRRYQLVVFRKHTRGGSAQNGGNTPSWQRGLKNLSTSTHNKQDEHPDGPQTCWLGLRKFFKKKQHKCALSFQKHMPATHLFSTIFTHVIPVGKFLVTTAVQAQRKPTNHFLTFHAALIVYGDHQSDIR